MTIARTMSVFLTIDLTPKAGQFISRVLGEFKQFKSNSAGVRPSLKISLKRDAFYSKSPTKELEARVGIGL